MGKNLSNKYSQKLFDHAKQSTRDALKTASKRAIQKLAEATGDLIGKKLSIKLQKNHHKILQRQSTVKQQYQKKDIYLQNKDSKLLMN